jgi:hypothetical protein
LTFFFLNNNKNQKTSKPMKKRSDSMPQRKSSTKIMKTSTTQQTRPTIRNLIPQNIWKDIIDMSGYHADRKKEMEILAEAVCCFQGNRFMWIPLLSVDPSLSKLSIKIERNRLSIARVYFDSDGNGNYTLHSELRVLDMALFFKIFLRYKIDMVDYFTENYDRRWALDGQCIEGFLRPDKQQPYQNNLKRFIKTLIRNKRKLDPAEVDFYKIICAQPLVKRSDENKKSTLSLQRQLKG